LGIVPTPPVPSTAVKLELTNNDPINWNTITLIVNGIYYAFPELGSITSGQDDAMYCSSAGIAGCILSVNLQTIGNANNEKPKRVV
jgi:hypothetical protein